MGHVTVIAAGILLGFVSAALAQEADVDAGAIYAKHVCAPCHAVLPNQQISPLPQAPTFQKVADTPGMTEMALSVWMQSSHPTLSCSKILHPQPEEQGLGTLCERGFG